MLVEGFDTCCLARNMLCLAKLDEPHHPNSSLLSPCRYETNRATGPRVPEGSVGLWASEPIHVAYTVVQLELAAGTI